MNEKVEASANQSWSVARDVRVMKLVHCWTSLKVRLSCTIAVKSQKRPKRKQQQPDHFPCRKKEQTAVQWFQLFCAEQTGAISAKVYEMIFLIKIESRENRMNDQKWRRNENNNSQGSGTWFWVREREWWEFVIPSGWLPANVVWPQNRSKAKKVNIFFEVNRSNRNMDN